MTTSCTDLVFIHTDRTESLANEIKRLKSEGEAVVAGPDLESEQFASMACNKNWKSASFFNSSVKASFSGLFFACLCHQTPQSHGC